MMGHTNSWQTAKILAKWTEDYADDVKYTEKVPTVE